MAESARACVRRGSALNLGLLRERTKESQVSALDNLATATHHQWLDWMKTHVVIKLLDMFENALKMMYEQQYVDETILIVTYFNDPYWF